MPTPKEAFGKKDDKPEEVATEEVPDDGPVDDGFIIGHDGERYLLAEYRADPTVE